MAYHAKGFRSLATPMGQPAENSGAGATAQIHTFVTNDDRAAVETANYFDALLNPKKVKKGDLMMVAMDVDGTPTSSTYIINIVGGHVVLIKQVATAAA